MKNKNNRSRLPEEDHEEVLETAGLTSPQIFEVIRLEGVAELGRPAKSLFWSGIAAGIALSLSIYCKGFFYGALEGSDLQEVLSNLGYTVGFLIVVLGRLQLFTENTITVVLPLLSDLGREKLTQTARLWGIVFLANMIGSFLSAWVVLNGNMFPPETTENFFYLSRELVDLSFKDAFMLAIPAGFIISAMVWLMPTAQSSGFWVVLLLTYIISLGGMTHVVAGSTEYFLLSLNGELSWTRSLFSGLFPTLIGNIIGGTGLFALISYGQVKEEIKSEPKD